MGSIFCRRVWRLKNDQSGQALTELAIIAPVFLFVLVAVVGLAQAGQRKAVVVRAAAAAARVAVVKPEAARAEALEVLRQTDPRITASDVDVAIEDVGGFRAPFSKPARVRVKYRYHPITGFGWRPVFNLRSEFVFDRWSNTVIFDIPSGNQ